MTNERKAVFISAAQLLLLLTALSLTTLITGLIFAA